MVGPLRGGGGKTPEPLRKKIMKHKKFIKKLHVNFNGQYRSTEKGKIDKLSENIIFSNLNLTD